MWYWRESARFTSPEFTGYFGIETRVVLCSRSLLAKNFQNQDRGEAFGAGNESGKRAVPEIASKGKYAGLGRPRYQD